MADAGASITLTAPTVAGDNFAGGDTAASSYDITANNDGGSPATTRSLQASIGVGGVGNNLKLSAEATEPTASGASAGAVVLTTSDQDLVTGIENVAESGIAIEYTLDLVNPAVVPSYGDQDITVTYTLTEDT